MSNAYYEKIARINLTTGEIKVEPLDLKIAQKFIGGRGLGTKILYDEGVATADPLSADNKLVYITGPMTGSNSPSSGRYMVVTKSPLTGMIACANSGAEVCRLGRADRGRRGAGVELHQHHGRQNRDPRRQRVPGYAERRDGRQAEGEARRCVFRPEHRPRR